MRRGQGCRHESNFRLKRKSVKAHSSLPPFVIDRSTQARALVADIYGVDKASMAIWFKNRASKVSKPEARRPIRPRGEDRYQPQRDDRPAGRKRHSDADPTPPGLLGLGMSPPLMGDMHHTNGSARQSFESLARLQPLLMLTTDFPIQSGLLPQREAFAESLLSWNALSPGTKSERGGPFPVSRSKGDTSQPVIASLAFGVTGRPSHRVNWLKDVNGRPGAEEGMPKRPRMDIKSDQASAGSGGSDDQDESVEDSGDGDKAVHGQSLMSMLPSLMQRQLIGKQSGTGLEDAATGKPAQEQEMAELRRELRAKDQRIEELQLLSQQPIWPQRIVPQGASLIGGGAPTQAVLLPPPPLSSPVAHATLVQQQPLSSVASAMLQLNQYPSSLQLMASGLPSAGGGLVFVSPAPALDVKRGCHPLTVVTATTDGQLPHIALQSPQLQNLPPLFNGVAGHQLELLLAQQQKMTNNQ